MNKPYDRKEVEQKQAYEEHKTAMKESEKSEHDRSDIPSAGQGAKPEEE